VVIAIIAILASLLLPALTRAKERAKGIKCVSNVRQMALSYILYADDHVDQCVNMCDLTQTALPGAFYPGSVTWWVDLLRPYLQGTNIIGCPDVMGGVQNVAGGPGGLGVAISTPELSATASVWRPKLATLKNPVKKVPFMDAGLVANPSEHNPDNWVEVPYQQALYSRVPSNVGWYDSDPQRAIGRHVKRSNAGFADGHAQSVKVSEMGLQFFPGQSGDTRIIATGIQWLGGNGQYDERWMWSWGS
jgi:prepilin-type processing-associated H-X9-DG protein